VSGALNALLYLLCLGTLVVNVPVLLFAPAQHPSWQFGAWLAGTMFLVTAIVSARPVIRREFLRRDQMRRASPSLQPGGERRGLAGGESVAFGCSVAHTGIVSSKYRSNRNVVFSCKYHVVWCPKHENQKRI
jgi:hypothetical protein